MLSKKKKKSTSTTSLEEKKLKPKKRKTKQFLPRSPYGTELELALALSKSLHDAEHEENVALGLISPSKLPPSEPIKIENSPPRNWLKRIKSTNQTSVTKFKRNALRLETVLQTSTINIQNRILTNNIATILMENDGCEEEKYLKNHLDGIKLNNVLWNDTTNRNEHVTGTFMDKSVCPEKNKRKSNETFGNENTTDNVCSTKNSLQSKIKRQKIDKESLDNEISDDDSDLEILVNLVGSYPNNDETPNSLKMTQSFQKVQETNSDSNLIKNSLETANECDNLHSKATLNFNSDKMINFKQVEHKPIEIDDINDCQGNCSNLIDLKEVNHTPVENKVINFKEIDRLPLEFPNLDNFCKSDLVNTDCEKENLNGDKIINLDEDHDSSSTKSEKENLNKSEIINLDEDSSSMNTIIYNEEENRIKNEIINLDEDNDSSSMNLDTTFLEKEKLDINIKLDENSDDSFVSAYEKESPNKNGINLNEDNLFMNSNIMNLGENNSNKNEENENSSFTHLNMNSEEECNLKKDEVVNLDDDSSSTDLNINNYKENDFGKNEIVNFEKDFEITYHEEELLNKNINMLENNDSSFMDLDDTMRTYHKKENLNKSEIINLDDDSSSMDLSTNSEEKNNLSKNKIFNFHEDDISSVNSVFTNHAKKNLNQNGVINLDEDNDNLSLNSIMNQEENKSNENKDIDFEKDKFFMEYFNENQISKGPDKIKSSNSEVAVAVDTYAHNFTTPELKRELNKYGLKFQSREKAIQLLQRIEKKLQPRIIDNKISDKNSNKSNVNENGNNLERNTSYENSNKINKIPSFEKTNLKSDLQKKMTNKNENSLQNKSNLSDFFQNDTEILKRIFKYEPLSLNALKAQLKSEKIKFKKDELLKYLDDQGVTVSMDGQGNKNNIR